MQPVWLPHLLQVPGPIRTDCRTAFKRPIIAKEQIKGKEGNVQASFPISGPDLSRILEGSLFRNPSWILGALPRVCPPPSCKAEILAQGNADLF